MSLLLLSSLHSRSDLIGLSILARLPWHAMSAARTSPQAPDIGSSSIEDTFESGILLQGYGIEYGYDVCRCHTPGGPSAVLYRFGWDTLSRQPFLRRFWADFCVRCPGCRIPLRPEGGRGFRTRAKKHISGNTPRRLFGWLHQFVPREGGWLGQAWL